nr:hypothetical protein [Cryobacterium glaciale]
MLERDCFADCRGQRLLAHNVLACPDRGECGFEMHRIGSDIIEDVYFRVLDDVTPIRRVVCPAVPRGGLAQRGFGAAGNRPKIDLRSSGPEDKGRVLGALLWALPMKP